MTLIFWLEFLVCEKLSNLTFNEGVFLRKQPNSSINSSVNLCKWAVVLTTFFTTASDSWNFNHSLNKDSFSYGEALIAITVTCFLILCGFSFWRGKWTNNRREFRHYVRHCAFTTESSAWTHCINWDPLSSRSASSIFEMGTNLQWVGSQQDKK